MTDEPTRIVAGVLPTQFAPSDAPAVIGLAAAAMAMVAAVGNGDREVFHQVLKAAAETYQRMRPEARDNVRAAADELVDCVRQGKTLLVMGGFRGREDPG